jgi:NitT/TauT family transport system permease protein
MTSPTAKPESSLASIAPTQDIGQVARRRRRVEATLSVVSPVLILVVWELLVWAGALDVRLFSAPSRIVGTFERMIVSGALFDHLQISLARIAAGFLIGAVPGVLLGTAMGLAPVLRSIFLPIIASLYPIPKIAIFPLIMVIFGLGEMSKYVLVAIAVFFFMAINSFAGVSNLERIYWDVGKSFKLSRAQSVLMIALPGAMPMIMAGIRLSLGMSLLVLVSAEFVGAKSGLGFLVWDSWQVFDIESMFVGIIVIGVLGWFFFAVIDAIERRFLPWAPSNRR